MPKVIAAFGEVMMRLQVPGYASLAQESSLNYSFSGTGVNIASALGRLGHAGYLVSTLPDNPLGDAAIAYLRKLGIDTSFISRGGKYVGMYFWRMALAFGPAGSLIRTGWGAVLIRRTLRCMIFRRLPGASM